MRRLHWKFYLAIVATLMIFLVAIFVVWHVVSSPLASAWGVESATELTARLLVSEPRASREQELIENLVHQLHADVALVAADGRVERAAMTGDFQFNGTALTQSGWHFFGNPTYGARLGDGRLLVVHPRHRMLLHGLHLALILIAVAG